MDFRLMSCPYCGSDIDNVDPQGSVCPTCSMELIRDRDNIRAFIRDDELQDTYNDAINKLRDGSTDKAMEVADSLMSEGAGNDWNPLFLRGAIFCAMGEDGKAINDWKAGMKMMNGYTDADKYVCLISYFMAKLIRSKEEECVEFDSVRALESLAESLDDCLQRPCKSYLFYSTLMQFVKDLDGDVDDDMLEIVEKLSRKIVAYSHDIPLLVTFIDELLDFVGYDEETFEDDDMLEYHAYSLICQRLKKYLSEMTPEDVARVESRWKDPDMTALDKKLNEVLALGNDNILPVHKDTGADPVQEIEVQVEKYVVMFLNPQETERIGPDRSQEEVKPFEEDLEPDDDQNDASEDLGAVADTTAEPVTDTESDTDKD